MGIVFSKLTSTQVKSILIFSCFFVIVIFTGCGGDQPKAIKQINEVKIAETPVKLTVLRLDDDLMRLNKDFGTNDVNVLKRKYGKFFDLYCRMLVKIGDPNNAEFERELKRFVTDKTICEVYDSVKVHYHKADDIKEELEAAFTRYRHFYRGKVIPDIVTFISGFNYGIVANDSVLGIGLDMYLGKDHPFYTMLNAPKYLTYSMNRYNIVPAAIKGWVETEFPFDENKHPDLLSQMIYEGKLLYVMDALLPDYNDSIKIRYTTKNMDWLKYNEGQCWRYFIDKKLLYTNDYMEKRKYFGEAPFTTGLPKEAPARIGQYLGWQIVRSYMSQQKKIDLVQLMNESNSQKILNLSKYKPK